MKLPANAAARHVLFLLVLIVGMALANIGIGASRCARVELVVVCDTADRTQGSSARSATLAVTTRRC